MPICYCVAIQTDALIILLCRRNKPVGYCRGLVFFSIFEPSLPAMASPAIDNRAVSGDGSRGCTSGLAEGPCSWFTGGQFSASFRAFCNRIVLSARKPARGTFCGPENTRHESARPDSGALLMEPNGCAASADANCRVICETLFSCVTRCFRNLKL